MEASSSYPTGSAPPLQSTPYVYHPQVPAQAGQHLASANEGSAPLVTVSYPVTNQTPSVPAVGQASETTGSGQDTSAPLVTITAWSQPGSATTSQQPVAHPPAGNVQQATVMPSDHHEAVASTLPHSGSATVASSQGVQVQPSPDPSPVPSVAGQGAQMGFQQAAVASSAPPGVGGQGMSTQGKDEQAFAPSAPPMVPQQAQAPMPSNACWPGGPRSAFSC
ncbi:conserved hypothetical protein [Perkinsus marinus ATCC 50983]|uniref:Uncharacterized protein n=1 Tax=Perkinsus marinus (strain ATCC 50983 / TXsc) TaxID=423536 RepID=C5KR93_PERM5|nr:conserved hypothetical protein [Perkinsus marinus ATCC 50983]EER12994.1 conserved hypothetical protein [Perkinsus marinus ATCC 50983]|eukprot:XP_002781199.1 conserved hypothetical protein [Perkinsus marinus ATCC 50983]